MRELDGISVYGLFKSGARKIGESRRELDRINVFPVPDGDTGSNMSYTLSVALETISVNRSAGVVLRDLSDSALASARGNSGVILAQFISGLHEGNGSTHAISLDGFVRAVENACVRAYEAIAKPREGTMLTAIREWSAALSEARREHETLRGLLDAAHPRLRAALAGTAETLPELRAAGVVDAGASGFAAMVDGFMEYASGDVRDAISPAGESERMDAGLAPAEPYGHYPEIRYCCEFLLRARDGERIDLAALRTLLGRYGDSVVVAGSASSCRVHVHADKPAPLSDALRIVGTVVQQKVDDMAMQYLDAHERVSDVAILSDSVCDIPDELALRLRIHRVPLLLRFGQDEYLDTLTVSPEGFYALADDSPEFPVSSQPPSASFDRMYANLSSHYKSVIAIHLSGELSGTCSVSRQAAAKIAEAEGIRADAFDSRHLSGSLGLIVVKAASMAAAGASHDQILAALPALSAGAENLVSVRTLRYMVRGGRVSPLRGWLAKALNLKPIVSVDNNGKSVLYGKAFSVKANEDKIIAMAKAIHANAPIRSWAVVHAAAPAAAAAFAARMARALGSEPDYICPISAIVGMNAGRGAVSFVCLSGNTA